MIRILVTGSRDWTDSAVIERDLLAAWKMFGTPPRHHVIVIHGGASGADSIAGAAAHRIGFNVEVFPAQWSTHGKRAGFVRNAEMVATCPDICLAYIKDQSKGATMTADLAEKAGIPTTRVTS